MNRLLNRLIADAMAPVEEMSTRFLKGAVLFFWAMGALLVSAAFLTVALFDLLQPLEGNAGTALILGCLYLGIATICIILTVRQKPHSRGGRARVSLEDGRLPPQKAEFAKNIDSAVKPIVEILRDAGMDRERVAIESAAELAKQLHPFSLVAFAMLGGLLLARLIKRDERPLS